MSEDFELYNQRSCFIHIGIPIFTKNKRMTAPSGRYQSKLFNLFSQSIDQLAKLQPHLRRIKSGAVWGTQVLFYLAHGLVQSINPWRSKSLRLAAGTEVTDAAALPQAVSFPEPVEPNQPIAVSADQPIQRLLLVAEQFGLSTSQPSSSSLDMPSIQGIATQLTTRTLVLVTTKNELLDCLTPRQQKLLHQRIVWAVVSYGFYTRLAHAGRLLGWPKISQVLPIVVPPKRLGGFSLPVLGHLGRRLPKLPRFRTVIPWQNRLVTGTAPTAIAMAELSIPALIRSAIAYFLSRHPWKLLPQASRQPVAHQAVIEGESSVAEPWLSWSDLFGSVESPIGTGATAIAGTEQSPSIASQTVQAPRGVVDEDWLDIETEAILMGYVKHPLERFLEWLDRLMTWLEGIVVTVWIRLRPR